MARRVADRMDEMHLLNTGGSYVGVIVVFDCHTEVRA